MFEQRHTGTPLRQTEKWQDHVGDIVEVRSDNRVVRRGIVDVEMPDGSGLWLAADAPDGREYFHKDLGYQLWI